MPNASEPADEAAIVGEADEIRCCAACAETDPAGDFPTVGDRIMCVECAHGIGAYPCGGCGEWSDTVRTVRRRSRATGATEDRERCESCVESFACAYCDEEWQDGQGFAVGSDTWCPPCADAHATRCDACGDLEPSDTVHGCESGDHSHCEGCAGSCSCGEDDGESPRGGTVNYRPARPETVPTVPDGIRFGMEIECRMPTAPTDWPTHFDGSLSSGNGELEAVSPVLSGTDGLRSLRGAVSAMERGECSPASNGGIHVHVSRAEPYTVQDVYRIVWHWTEWAEHFASYFVPGFRLSGQCYNAPLAGPGGRESRRASSGCGPETYRAIRRYAEQPTDNHSAPNRWALTVGENGRARNFPRWERWRALNLESLWVHGTIEFRIFPSLPVADAATLYAAFCARFVAFAVATDPEHARRGIGRFGPGRFGLRVLSRGSRRFAELVHAEHARIVRARGFQTEDVGFSPAHEAARDPWGAARTAETRTGFLPGFGPSYGLPGEPVTLETVTREPEPASEPETPRIPPDSVAPCGSQWPASVYDAPRQTGCILAGVCPHAHDCAAVAGLRVMAEHRRPRAYEPETHARLRRGCRCGGCREVRNMIYRPIRDRVEAGRNVRHNVAEIRQRIACGVGDVPNARAAAAVRRESETRARALRGPSPTPRVLAYSDVARMIGSNRDAARESSRALWIHGAGVRVPAMPTARRTRRPAGAPAAPGAALGGAS